MTFLRAAGLSKRFGGFQCLTDVSFAVSEGEIAGIIGPNGAGKTTLFNLITGFLPPTSGRITFQGEDVTDFQPHLMAQRGVVRTFQVLNLFNEMTALENVMVGLHLSDRTPWWVSTLGLPAAWRERARREREAMRLLEFVGLASEAHRPAGELSFGQQRLLDTARALAPSPKLLLLDEPVSGLSPLEKENFARLLQEIRAQGITVLLVEHDMALVMSACQRVMVLSSGSLIAEGPPERVQADSAVRSAYLGEEAL